MPCAFHSARSPEDLASVVVGAVEVHGAIGLYRVVQAAMARLDEALPAPLVLAAAEASAEKLEQLFDKVLNVDSFDARTLRRLAACALSLALLMEARQAGQEVSHAPSPSDR